MIDVASSFSFGVKNIGRGIGGQRIAHVLLKSWVNARCSTATALEQPDWTDKA